MNNANTDLLTIIDMMQHHLWWNQLYAAALNANDSRKCQLMRIKIAVTENTLLDFVPDNLLNELGF